MSKAAELEVVRPGEPVAEGAEQPTAQVQGKSEDEAYETHGAKSWSVSMGSPGLFRLSFNPVVTVASIVIIWGFVAWCMADPIKMAV